MKDRNAGKARSSTTDPEFIEIAGYPVLLPVDREHHPNITILRCIASEDHPALTIFLKDTTYVTDRPVGPAVVVALAESRSGQLA